MLPESRHELRREVNEEIELFHVHDTLVVIAVPCKSGLKQRSETTVEHRKEKIRLVGVGSLRLLRWFPLCFELIHLRLAWRINCQHVLLGVNP